MNRVNEEGIAPCTTNLFTHLTLQWECPPRRFGGLVDIHRWKVYECNIDTKSRRWPEKQKSLLNSQLVCVWIWASAFCLYSHNCRSCRSWKQKPEWHQHTVRVDINRGLEGCLSLTVKKESLGEYYIFSVLNAPMINYKVNIWSVRFQKENEYGVGRWWCST